MKYVANQIGDTLVEVIMAVAIISGTLASAYAVANNSYKIGVQARERTEAINLAQQQAELLRARRDLLISQNPEAGGPNVLPVDGASFRVLPNAGLTTEGCAPPPGGCAAGSGNRYSVSITSTPAGPDISPGPGREGRDYVIRVSWVRIGGSTSDLEQTEIPLTLVDRRLNKSTIDCNEVEQCS